jgi:hypothetical protein
LSGLLKTMCPTPLSRRLMIFSLMARPFRSRLFR